MVDSPRKRLVRSPSPWEEKSRSRSTSRSRSRSWSRPRSRSRSRSRGRDEEVNPGHTLYVTGLSTRVTERDLEDHFSKEGKVKSVFLVVEPRSRISRGFAFITMDAVEDANRCIKHLNQSILEGRYITVEKSRRKRGRTPTPGHYLGLKSTRGNGARGNRPGGSGRDDYGYRRSPRPSPYRGGRDYSPRPSHYRGERDHSPRPSSYGGGRDYSPRPSSYRVGRDYSPRPSSYRGGHDYSARHSPHGRRSRRDRSRSYSPQRSPERNYARGSR